MTGIRNGYDGIVGVLLQVHQKEQRKLRRGSDKSLHLCTAKQSSGDDSFGIFMS